MADYAGAVAAIQARLTANWTTTKVGFQNDKPPSTPWPPVDGNGDPEPWVYFEVIGNGSALRGAGLPGSQEWLYEGHLLAHVYVPVQTGIAVAHQHAVAIGEIFRVKQFYETAPATCVRTGYGDGPWTDGGEMNPEHGTYFRVTMTCPFQFYYRG